VEASQAGGRWPACLARSVRRWPALCAVGRRGEADGEHARALSRAPRTAAHTSRPAPRNASIHG
jgi:hypothetical protein